MTDVTRVIKFLEDVLENGFVDKEVYWHNKLHDAISGFIDSGTELPGWFEEHVTLLHQFAKDCQAEGCTYITATPDSTLHITTRGGIVSVFDIDVTDTHGHRVYVICTRMTDGTMVFPDRRSLKDILTCLHGGAYMEIEEPVDEKVPDILDRYKVTKSDITTSMEFLTHHGDFVSS